MARDVVDEGCASVAEFRYFGIDDEAIVPTTLEYAITDLTNCRTLVTGVAIPVAHAVQIEIDATYNTIYSQDIGQQQNALTVTANKGLPKQQISEMTYVIRNLRSVR